MLTLELRNLSAGYGSDAVLHGIDIEISRGEIVTLIGANGAGKSALVNAVSGMIPTLAGEILFDGRCIERLDTSSRLKLGISHVPEGRRIFAGMTVAENLRLGAFLSQSADWLPRAQRIFRYFPVLEERLSSVAGNFSGGQQQMLAIARGLMSAPKLLLLDEPSLGLSPLLVDEIFGLVRLLRDEGLTILLVEQNARQALQIADRGYVMENGKVVLSGRAEELLAEPAVSERYLGVGAPDPGAGRGSSDLAARLSRCLLR